MEEKMQSVKGEITKEEYEYLSKKELQRTTFCNFPIWRS